MSPIDRELERTLAQRAGQLEPPADLYAAVTKEAGAMRRRRQGAVAGAALTVLAIAIAVPLALRDNSGRDNGLVGNGTPTPSVSIEPSTEPSTDTTASTPPSSEPTPVTAAVPVYYVGGGDDRPVLYREFHRTDVAAGKALAGARLAVDTQPKDSDYTNLFPTGSRVNNVAIAASQATVDLNARATEGTSGALYEGAALDAIVWSVTAADTSVKTVKFTVDGQVKQDFWGHIDLTGTFRRQAQEDVLAPVWLLQPEFGSSVGRTFTIGGQATVFEANVTWEVYSGADKVASGFDTASIGAPGRGDWSASVTIPASVAVGTPLEIRAFESSAEDGRPLFIDSKTVTLL
jgi:hypothetical protein